MKQLTLRKIPPIVEEKLREIDEEIWKQTNVCLDTNAYSQVMQNHKK